MRRTALPLGSSSGSYTERRGGGDCYFPDILAATAMPLEFSTETQDGAVSSSCLGMPLQESQAGGRGVDWDDDDPRWEDAPLRHMLTPTAVYFGVAVEHVKEVDTTMSTCRVWQMVYLQWHDARLVGRQIKPFGNRNLPPRLWAPHLSIDEAMADMSVEIVSFLHLNFSYLKCAEGDLLTHTHLEGTISIDMDLHDVPFDTQNLTMTYRANRYRLRDGDIGFNCKGDYRLLPMLPATGHYPVAGAGGGDTLEVDTDLGSPEWKYVGTHTDFIERDISASDTYRVSIVLTRNHTYFTDKIIVPLVVITLLNGFAFAIPVEDLSDRLAHTVSLYLSSLALLFIVGEELPKTKYRTVIDSVIAVTNGFLVSTCIESVICQEFASSNPGNVRWFNFLAGLIYGMCFVAYKFVMFRPLLAKRKEAVKAARTAAEGEQHTEIAIRAKKQTHETQAKRHDVHLFVGPGQIDHIECVNRDITSNYLVILESMLYKKKAPEVIFVEPTSEHRLVFDVEAPDMRAGAPFYKLASHPGFCLTMALPHAGAFGRFLLVDLAVAPIGYHDLPKVELRYEEPFLVHQGMRGRENTDEKYGDHPMVVNINQWLYEMGSGVGLLASVSSEGTRMTGGGRDFLINDDGTISATKIPGAVLGLRFDPRDVEWD